MAADPKVLAAVKAAVKKGQDDVSKLKKLDEQLKAGMSRASKAAKK